MATFGAAAVATNQNPNKSIEVKMWTLLSGGQPVTVAMHDAPIKEVAWIPEMNLLATGSWDKTLKYWDARQPNPVHTQQPPDCCYALTVRYHEISTYGCWHCR